MRATAISPHCRELVVYFEDAKLLCYRTHTRPLEGQKEFVDVPTIGYGHTGQIIDPKTGVKRDLTLDDVGTLRITEADALRYLDDDLAEADRKVDRYFPKVPLTQGQRDALASLAFNIRQKWLRSEYTLAKMVLAGTWTPPLDVLEAFVLYRNARTGVEKGLFRRRLAEGLMALGLPWKPAVKADLKRDRAGDLQYMTDPAYVLLEAQNLADGQAILEEGGVDLVPKPIAPASPSSTTGRPIVTQALADAKPSNADLPPRVVLTPDPEPVVREEPLPPPRKAHSRNSLPAEEWGIDADAPLKPAEESETVHGVGIEREAQKILDALRVLLPSSSFGAVVAWVEGASFKAILVALVAFLAIVAAVYEIRRRRGRAMKRIGRERASQAVR